MKIIFAFIISIAFSYNSFSQNVGIGTNVPSEKLDVNGSINLTENLKFDNDGGQAGDLLMIGNNGQPSWTFGGNYKFSRMITSLSSTTFTVPSDVNEIFIESWGPGGGGSIFAGGGGGVYEAYLIYAANLLTVTTDNGAGGSPSTNETGSGLNGDNNVVTLNYTNPITITIEGGDGATSNVAGNRTNLLLSNLSTNLLAHFGLPGNCGKPAEAQYYYNGGELLRTVFSKADGGDGLGVFATPNFGATFYDNALNNTFGIISLSSTTNSYNHGGAGGFRGLASLYGYEGGDGITIIRWN